jgi:hypothetical protein
METEVGTTVQVREPVTLLIPLPARWLVGRGKLFFVSFTQGGARSSLTLR